ncbi:hypothetical protein FA13DRAFT_1804948 [Coprinellus micaceus]|uniref:Uncharacterized protein n=1 Tax=Coprinellus micaceus TaxID=71717 RepID=A0A4Y7S2V5_COPMI|nr:hypothetical protein FA13DRAFT_1804948 [Coprinellus micaceus]
MRAEHVVEEDIEDVRGGGGVVQEQGGHGGRVVQMAFEITASKSSSSSKFMEVIGGGEGDDGGAGERVDGARDRDGSRSGGSSGCASAGEGAQGQLDIHADVDIRLHNNPPPLGAYPSSPPQPQNSNWAATAHPQGSTELRRRGRWVVGPPHNDPALGDEEDVTSPREELVEIAGSKGNHTAYIASAAHPQRAHPPKSAHN